MYLFQLNVGLDQQQMCVLLKTNKQTATLVNFIEPLHMYFIFDLSALSTQNHAVTPATSKRYHGYLL